MARITQIVALVAVSALAADAFTGELMNECFQNLLSHVHCEYLSHLSNFIKQQQFPACPDKALLL